MAEEVRQSTLMASGSGDEAPPPDFELARLQLRRRWELASILNFLNVFEPVIGMELKISAEEIETGLIEPNESLAQLHVVLLKGIPPMSRLLKHSNGWVTVLSKKLTVWWPWVAEGDFPLSPAKGEEISTYKAVNPITRLLLLKALCEIRAEQGDILHYINDSMKNGVDLSTFRKEKFGGDGSGIYYWYDGNKTIGHRLYKEILKIDSKPELGGDNGLAINSQWETLATNLEEFRAFVDNVSCSEHIWEGAVGEAVQANIIPVLEKIQKKKDRALIRQRSQDTNFGGFRRSTRSSRSHGPVDYRYDGYDKAIREAIQVTNNKKTTKERGTTLGTVHEKISATGNESTASDVADDTSDENDGEKVADAMEDDMVTEHFKRESRVDNNDHSILNSRVDQSLLDPDYLQMKRNITPIVEYEVVPDSEAED